MSSAAGRSSTAVDLPGSNDLYVVSVHLYASGNSTDRNNEAIAIKNNIQANFPAGAWVIVAGDMNTGTRTEPAIATFKTFLSDSPIPSDAVVGGDEDTNLNRNSPYDYVLPSFSMTNTLTNVVIASQSFPKGLVFDSRVFTPLADVAPVQMYDSTNCQHMAVIKDFYVNGGGTNPPPSAPVITDQPDSLNVVEGNNAAFSVTATGAAPLAYQWRFNEMTLPGETNTSYTRLNAQPADAGDYTVVVTNGSGSVTSAVAVLTVLPPGGGGTGDVIAQWDFNDGTLSPSIGSGTAGYTGGATANPGGEFAGGSSTDPTLGTNQAWNTSTYPAQGTANKTAGVRFAVSTLGKEQISIAWDVRASNTGSKYTRLQYTTNGTTYFDFPVTVVNPTSFGRRTNDLSSIAGVSDNPAFAFRIVAEFESTAINSGSAIYAGAGTTYGTSGTLRYDMMTVYGSTIVPPPEITVQPLSQNQPEGSGLLLSVEADGTPPLDYQWYKDLGPIPGATNSGFSLGSATTNDTGDYFVIVSGPSGAVTSSVASVVIYRPLNIDSPFSGLTAIWGRNALLTVGATGSDPLGYQWYRAGTPLGGATNATLLFPGVQFTNAGLYSVIVSSPYDQATNPPAPLVVIPAGVSVGIYGELAGLTLTGAIAN
ncbi:MAG: immunoglobulin domain-containing protein, partial [Verrucomicrobia bacterium]|nr:immunoglobulin domain-containing protein [Verrucomicrobiota bacterium]